MNAEHPFVRADLNELGELLDRADRVVPMREIAGGDLDPLVIGMRHDVDNVLGPAVAMARWERQRGYRSTYYILHTAPYWADKLLLQVALEQIAEDGHEIGIHNNALADALTTGRDPVEILAEAVDELRSMGHEVVGTCGHGDNRCYDNDGKVWFTNDQIWAECVRPTFTGIFDRLNFTPVPLADFGLEYDSAWLSRAEYLSDSGGQWSRPFEDIAAGYPYPGQLHMLVHPDWWTAAFTT